MSHGPGEELRRDRRHEWWLLAKGAVSAGCVVVLVIVRQRYWV